MTGLIFTTTILRRVVTHYAAFLCAAVWLTIGAATMSPAVAGLPADETPTNASSASEPSSDAAAADADATAKKAQLPPALRRWQPSPARIIFSGRPGRWDAEIRERGWILLHDGRYHLWYTGYNRLRSPLDMKLGYATSKDGIRWQRRDQPIFDDVWVEDMMVVLHEGTFYMFAEGADDQAQLLTSDNGTQWKRQGPLDVRLTTGDPIPDGPYGTPTAWFEDGTWSLFYERRDQGIWLATSSDLKTWTNVTDDPVITPGPDDYDQRMIAMNQVIRYDDKYYAVLHGTGTATKPRQWCTYFAVSDDLRTWAKAERGPVLPIQDNKSSGVLVPDGDGFVLYTMHAGVVRHTPVTE